MPVDTAHLRIVHYPHPALRRTAAPVEAVTDELRDVAKRMLELMHASDGVGLAAPQVDLGWRLFVANPTGQADDDRVYINPQLTDPTPHTDRVEEGCLSIPDVRAPIMRPVGITISATDLDGQSFTDTAEQLLARIWQHETDHLNGVLILDRMTPADRRVNRRAIELLESGNGR
jgi:peptide deformylase